MRSSSKKTARDPEAKTRQCLVCKQEFVSTWSGNRVCNRCRQSAIWKQGA